MKLAYLLFLFICINVNSQNLVSNPSFEDYSSCPVNGGEIYFVNFWSSPTNGTPDYMNSCNTTTLGIPQNAGGFELPINGFGYLGLYTFNIYSNNVREYIQTELIDSLTKNKNYYVEFYVSLADSFQYATNYIGAYLSNNPISNYIDNFLFVTPQIDNTNNSLAVKDGWVKIYGTFKANGGEKYLTIGNFMPDSLSDTVFVGGGKPSWKFAYYYIDAVTVMLDTTVGVSEEVRVEREKFRLYPNPVISGNELNIYLSENKGNSAIEIYNVMGSLIQSLPVTSVNVKIKTENLSKGIYYIKLLNNNEYVDIEKVIVY